MPPPLALQVPPPRTAFPAGAAGTANFILPRVGEQADALRAALLKAGILVRDGAAVGFPGHLRISIGTRENNDRLLEAWDQSGSTR